MNVMMASSVESCQIPPLLGESPRQARTLGFSLIELMIVLAVMAILSLIAVPAFNTWVANSRLRAVANDMASGIRLAQIEALRRSRQTVFALTSNPNPRGDTSVSLAAAPPNYKVDGAPGSNWWAVSVAPNTVDNNNAPSSGSHNSGTFINGSSIADIAAGVDITGPTVLCFSTMGRLIDTSNPRTIDTGLGVDCADLPQVENKFLQIYKLESTSNAASLKLQIEVGLGGQVRICDPRIALDLSNGPTSQGCQVTSGPEPENP